MTALAVVLGMVVVALLVYVRMLRDLAAGWAAESNEMYALIKDHAPDLLPQADVIVGADL